MDLYIYYYKTLIILTLVNVIKKIDNGFLQNLAFLSFLTFTQKLVVDFLIVSVSLILLFVFEVFNRFYILFLINLVSIYL
jgi:hypothetical protein